MAFLFQLSASYGVANDYFGSSASISEDYVCIGAYNEDIGGNADQGSVYIFNK